MGSRCLLVILVSGNSLLPVPPASTMPFIILHHTIPVRVLTRSGEMTGAYTFSGTPPLAYGVPSGPGSATLAKSMSVPSRDGNGAVSFPVIPRTCTRPEMTALWWSAQPIGAAEEYPVHSDPTACSLPYSLRLARG